MDYSLFPKKEEWGTGDEAMDSRLSLALREVQDNLTFDSICDFYYYGCSLKPRTFNPSFQETITFVVKAFLNAVYPEEFIDQMMLKVKGDYRSKKKIDFIFPEFSLILEEFRKNKSYRYKNEMDFYLHRQSVSERNPFVRNQMKRSSFELHVKIIMKDLRAYFDGQKEQSFKTDPLFNALYMGKQVLVIEHFAEVWYHQGQIFSLPLFESDVL